MKEIKGFEWQCLRMAVRHSMNRQTIESATFPADFISNAYHRLSEGQRKSILEDLRDNDRHHGAFGNPETDRPIWVKLMSALNSDEHEQIEMTDGTVHTCFRANGRIYPLAEYLKNPHRELFVPVESIKK